MVILTAVGHREVLGMTLPLKQVDTIFIAQLTNPHATFKYLQKLRKCVMTLRIERDCYSTYHYSKDDGLFLKTSP
jgi:hypothetical protein